MTAPDARRQIIKDLAVSMSLAMVLIVVVLFDQNLTGWISHRSSEVSSSLLVVATHTATSDSIAASGKDEFGVHTSGTPMERGESLQSESDRRRFDESGRYKKQEERPKEKLEPDNSDTSGGSNDSYDKRGSGNIPKKVASAFIHFDLPALNERVLEFSHNSIGKQIGRGECWDLADQALRAAGAEPPDGYAFGNRVEIGNVMPGDILQFTSARFAEGGRWMLMGAPHHTAIVQAISKDRLFILHQNVSGNRHVVECDISLDYMISGDLEAFRPRLSGICR